MSDMKNKKLYIGLAIAFIAVAAVYLLGVAEGNESTLIMAVGPAFAPLKWPVGRNNMGGFKGYLLYVPEYAATQVPTVPKWEEATDNSDLVTAAGSFVFPEQGTIKMPLYLYNTDAKVGYSVEAQGELDGISYKQTLTGFFPGNMKEAHAFAALVKNTRGYYIYEDTDGNQMMIGQPGMAASTSVSYNGGQARADLRGHTFTITADSNYSAIFLETPIDVDAIMGGTWTSAGVGG